MQKTTLITLVLTVFVTLASRSQFPGKPQLAKDPWTRTEFMAPTSLLNLPANIKTDRINKLYPVG